MTFPDHTEFKAAVREHSIKWGREIKFTMNQPEKVQAKCQHETCQWKIYASQIKGEITMQVKTYVGKHKCPRLQKISHANAKWVAEKYYNRLCLDPKWDVDVMGKILKNEVKLEFTRHQLYRAKKIASSLGGDNYAEQYAILWNYAEELKIANPDTTVMIKCKYVGGQPLFKRMYICWGPLKKGLLENCRPLISLDGCHLKTVQGGILLTALGIDGNNDPYPVAYAVVEKEKKKSWAWFLKLLKKDLHIQNHYSWTIMSDKQKGLIDVVEQVLGGCEHRFCVMHLYQNFKLLHRGLALKNMLWKAARSTRVVDFEKTMSELKERDAAAYGWLAKRPPAQWSKSHFSTFCKSDMLLNNLSECFNSMILNARKLPIVDMFETIRHLLMKRVHVRRDLMLKNGRKICPKILKLLEEWKKKAMDFHALWNGKDQFEVEHHSGGRWKVHTGEHECSCRRWQLTGIPCPHAISALYYLCVEHEDYIHDCYSSEKFIKAYSYLIPTLSSIDEWPNLTNMKPLVPPVPQRLPGRPKNNDRKKDKNEKPQNKKTVTKMSRKGMKMTCSKCHQQNHNSKGCPLNKGDRVGMDIPAPVDEGNRARKSRGNGSKIDVGGSKMAATKGRKSKSISTAREPSAVTDNTTEGNREFMAPTTNNRSPPSKRTFPASKEITNAVQQPKGTKKKLKVTKNTGEVCTQASRNIVSDNNKGKKLFTPQGMNNVKFSNSKGRSSNVMTAATSQQQGQEAPLGSYWVAIPKI